MGRLIRRPGAPLGLCWLLLLSPSARAQAEPAELQLALLRGPEFSFVPDGIGLAESACGSRAIARALLPRVAKQMQRELGVDPQLLLVFASDPLGCEELFYLPMANDIRGIGYQHEDARELFDDSPESALEGIVFLNDIAYWRRHPDEFASAFHHEVAHRWGARVHVQLPGLPAEALLGREQQHWSYYLETGGSALEGNSWMAAAEGRFRAHSPVELAGFSDLDLYLMGALSPADVRPSFLVRPTSEHGEDCSGSSFSAASPPQWCMPHEVAGATVPVTAADVIAAEGEREPAAAFPRVLSAAVVLLASGADSFDEAACVHFSAALRARMEAFRAATRGRIALRNLTHAEADCATFARAEAPRHAESCSVHGNARPELSPAASLLGIIAAWLFRRQSPRAKDGRGASVRRTRATATTRAPEAPRD